MSNQSTPRIESLCIQNYRVLHDLELKGITPLTVFLGPNGSGKSTIFHALTFLSDCLQYGLLTASQWHGPLRFLRTSGAEGAIVIELSYRESPDSALITYHLAVNEENDKPFVTEEWLE
jgi:predicted ATPase